MKINVDTKYDIGNTVEYTDEYGYDTVRRKVIIRDINVTFNHNSSPTSVICYYIHRVGDSHNCYDEWVLESDLRDYKG
jgi:hypothetical protein